jgi:hypothetical protein
VELGLSFDDGTSDVDCRCDGCDAEWAVALNAMQTLRMRLCPPAGLVVM